MSGEEMEISLDDGNHPAMYDMDIDLGFQAAAVDADEDLVLDDFDEVEEIMHFNSDTGDELMAERDNGMVVDDIDYNDAAVASNDYDIDLGMDSGWDENTTAGVDGTVAPTEPSREIGALVTAEQSNIASNEAWMQTELSIYPDDSDAAQPPAGNEGANLGQADDTDYSRLPNRSPSEDVAHQVLGVDQDTTTHNARSAERDGPKSPVLQSDSAVNEPWDPESAAKLGATEGQEATDTHALEFPDAYKGDGIEKQEPSPSHENVIGDTASQQEATDMSAEQDRGSKSTDPTKAADGNPEGPEDDSGEATAQWTDDAASFYDDEIYQTHDDLHDENAGKKDEPIESDQHDTQLAPSPASSGDDVADERAGPHGEGTSSHAFRNDTVAEDTSELARRYQPWVRYGDLDYRLFAKSEEDDPDQYFLKDFSAVDDDFGSFLTSIRTVIAEEVSLLDEIALHIDGLGLEIAETMSQDFLASTSFGEILHVYDRLVKNEVAQRPEAQHDSFDLYMKLIIRPNCGQRFTALKHGVENGRTLTQVALWTMSPLFDNSICHRATRAVAMVPDDDGDDSFDVDTDQYEQDPDGQYVGQDPDQDADEYDSTEYEDQNEYEGTSEFGDEDQENSNNHGGAQSLVGEQYGIDGNDASDQDQRISSTPDQGETADAGGHGAEPVYDVNEAPVSDTATAKGVLTSPEATTRGLKTQVSKEDDAAPAAEVEPPAQAVGDVSGNPDGNSYTIEANGDTPSHLSSPTDILDGEKKDEIDYSDDELDPAVSPAVQAGDYVEDEITWESDEELEATDQAAEQSAEVSPARLGKRSRAEYDATEGAGEKSDVKRHRGSS